MKLLISDYDGTFNPYFIKSIVNKNIDEIKRFQKKGNIFAISTARSYESIKKEIKKYNIPYNYLICNNGSVILDKKDELIYNDYIDDAFITYFIDIVSFIYEIETMDFYNGLGETTNENITSVKIKTKKIFNPLKVHDLVNNNTLNVRIQTLINKINMSKISNKKEAIISLLKNIKEKIDVEDVYTVGNGSKDKEMLKSFNGHKMPLSSPCLLFSDIPFTENVNTLVKKIR